MLSQGYYDHEEDSYARMRTNQIHLRLAGQTKKCLQTPRIQRKHNNKKVDEKSLVQEGLFAENELNPRIFCATLIVTPHVGLAFL